MCRDDNWANRGMLFSFPSSLSCFPNSHLHTHTIQSGIPHPHFQWKTGLVLPSYKSTIKYLKDKQKKKKEARNYIGLRQLTKPKFCF